MLYEAHDMHSILIIDDDKELCALLTEYLEAESFSCRSAATAEEGLSLARAARWDMVILDVMLPGRNGFEVLRELRGDAFARDLPVLMLTARGEEIDRIVGLELGADDYLSKPFSARELLARMRAVLRRAQGTRADAADSSAPRVVGDLRLWAGSLRAAIGERTTEISTVELRLLEQLLEKPGAVISREHLYRTVLGHNAYPFDRSLDMLVSRLRKKLGPRADDGERIRAVRGEGYMYLLPGGKP